MKNDNYFIMFKHLLFIFLIHVITKGYLIQTDIDDNIILL